MMIFTFLLITQIANTQIVNPNTQNTGEKAAATASSTALPQAQGDTQQAPSAKPAASQSQVDLLFFADIDGRISRPGCGGGQRHTAPEFLHLKQLIRAMRVTSEEEGIKPPLPVFGGSFIGPDPFGEFLFDSPSGARKAAQLLDLTGAEVIAVGPRDLESGLVRFKNYVQAMNQRGRKLLASNLSVKGLSFERYQIIKRGEKRLLFMSLLPVSEIKFLPDAEGISIEDPKKIYAKILKETAGRYDLVILVSHLDTTWSYPEHTLSFLKSLSSPPNLVLVTSVFREGDTKFLDYMKMSPKTTILASHRYGYSLTAARIKLDDSTGSTDIAPRLIQTEIKPLPVRERSFIDAMMDSFCKANHRSLGVKLSKPWTFDKFSQYVLGMMQAKANADIAVIDRRMFMNADLPMNGELTAEDLLRRLRSDSPVVLMKLKGSAIKSMLGKYLSKDSPIVLRGLEKKGGKLYVNGRELSDNVRYRVATTKFLAAGGGGWLPKTPFTQIAPGVRSTLISWLKETRDPSEHALPDMLSKYSIYAITNTGASLTMTKVKNTTLYPEKGDLPAEGSSAVNLDITVDAGIANAYHSLSTHIQIIYGKAWMEGGSSTETKDEVKSSALYQWKGWAEGGSGGTWYPIPFVELTGNTEVTPSLSSDKRAYAVASIAGIGLEPWRNRLFFKLGAGFRQSRDDNGIDEYSTAYFGWQLTGGPLTTIYGTPLKGESRLDGYFYQQGKKTWDIQATTKVYLVTSESLSFFMSHTLTAYKKGSESWLWVTEFMFGLNFTVDGSIPLM